MRIEDFGYHIGALPRGPLNKITDVPGVRVGHCTVWDDHHKTGVTVVLPCEDDPFLRKLTAAGCVLNGFGKTAGLMQVEELGSIETPIAFTGTLNVGRIFDATVSYVHEQAAKAGVRVASVNPMVCECNDSRFNDLDDRICGEAEYRRAISSACRDFEEGAVGAGSGMSCHGLKGGIGSASRLLDIGGRSFTLGVLALTNHGSLEDLRIDGDKAGEEIARRMRAQSEEDRGSCILLLACDLPLTSRQLKRVVRRMGIGLARNGSFFGHGSGDVCVGFTTANRKGGDDPFRQVEALREDLLNLPFRAAAEAAEEAVLNALAASRATTGCGVTRRALSEFMPLKGGSGPCST